MRFAFLFTAALAVAGPVSAQQQSEGYKFLQAVRDAKNDDVINALLRLTAFCTSASSTISFTNARRAGLSNATVTPPTIATA